MATALGRESSSARFSSFAEPNLQPNVPLARQRDPALAPFGIAELVHQRNAPNAPLGLALDAMIAADSSS
jgi:hypothetical protein